MAFVGGLASGLDGDLIIESMVARQKVVIARIAERQKSTTARVSAFGELASQLSSLRDIARGLKDEGVRATNVTSENVAFSAEATGKGTPGQFSVSVENLATAAKTRSVPFSAPNAQVRAGTLSISVQGAEAVEVDIAEGATLADVADALNKSGAPINATIISDGTSSYLSISNRETGHPVGSPGDSALVITQHVSGLEGSPLFSITETGLPTEIRAGATNAVFQVDGLRIERPSNAVTDVLPGVKLTLKAPSALDPDGLRTSEDLVFSEDSTETRKRLETFVDAYNGIVRLMERYKGKPAAGAGEARVQGALSGESTMRSLQVEMQDLLGRLVPGGNGARNLAEAGVILEKDGTVRLDSAAFDKAMASDPNALDRIFGDKDGGLASALDEMVRQYTNSVDGHFTTRQDGLKDVAKRLGDDIERMEAHLEKTRDTLVRQFLALEEMISKFNGLTQFLEQQAALQAKKS